MHLGSKRQYKNDILLGMGLLVTALCLWLITNIISAIGIGGGSGNLMAVIYVDGEEYGTYPLSRDESVEITVSEHNKVVICDGAVWMEEAECPDKLCINQGRIKSAGQTIICLPNRVMVTITGGNSEYDGVAQ